MKKLQLNLGGNMQETLSKDQMRRVTGGAGGGPCAGSFAAVTGCDDDGGSECGADKECTDPANYWCVNGICQRR